MTLLQTIDFSIPVHDLTSDSSGNLYVVESVATTNNHRIHKFDSQGTPITAWGSAGSGEGEFAFAPPPNGPALHGGFIVVDEVGDVYISDTFNHRVQKFDANGTFLSVWASRDAAGAPFEAPGPISADGHGHIYVADFQGVTQFDLAGTYTGSFSAGGEAGMDSEGNLYITSAFQNLVQKFDVAGVANTPWGGAGRDNGQFDFPLFLVVDRQDHVYVSDHSGRIQKFDADGTFLSKWEAPGNGNGSLPETVGIALDQDGNLYAWPVHRTSIYRLRIR